MTGKIAALIVAAGEGNRAGGAVPKQYQVIAGKSVLKRSVEAFQNHPSISEVRVVIHPNHAALYEKEGLSLGAAILGGKTRQESVLNGLKAIGKPEHVLIHDAARPFVKVDVIDRVVEALKRFDAVVPALPVTDTLKKGNGKLITGGVDREGIYRVQTPQGFRFKTILTLHEQYAGKALTDDAALAELAGIDVQMVAGDERNEKLTTVGDMNRAAMAQAYEFRVGSGYDVHRLVPHDSQVSSRKQMVMLCGVPVPFEMKLEGHSDADVGLHALVDALLGAMAEGDIGTHFPPTDPRWRGADSARFVIHAHHLLKQRGAIIQNIDITFICEQPKIGPQRMAMIKSVSQMLDIDPKRVSIKATTTEKMGFLGRGEGIAAQAIASIKIPA